MKDFGLMVIGAIIATMIASTIAYSHERDIVRQIQKTGNSGYACWSAVIKGIATDR